MWGTWDLVQICNIAFRFIPTHVGNMPFANPGENAGGGSSPRMWGTYITMIRVYPSRRFIPTHVGNICPYFAMSLLYSVHPHACGEHLSRRDKTASFAGSSPRMWGTCVPNGKRFRCYRFIPTHVGNIYPATWSTACTSVHPHACGEHT